MQRHTGCMSRVRRVTATMKAVCGTVAMHLVGLRQSIGTNKQKARKWEQQAPIATEDQETLHRDSVVHDPPTIAR